MGALFNHYQTATRTTAAFVRATVIIALTTANVHPRGRVLAVAVTEGSNARAAVRVLTRASATTTDKEVGKQLKHKPVK